jgi:hypothetical protein
VRAGQMDEGEPLPFKPMPIHSAPFVCAQTSPCPRRRKISGVTPFCGIRMSRRADSAGMIDSLTLGILVHEGDELTKPSPGNPKMSRCFVYLYAQTL